MLSVTLLFSSVNPNARGGCLRLLPLSEYRVIKCKTGFYRQRRRFLITIARGAGGAADVHLGFGAFHRASEGLYTDILCGTLATGAVEVICGGEQQIADLKQQDNTLYSGGKMSAEADGAGGRRQSGVACSG